jgi:hypothetical protein
MVRAAKRYVASMSHGIAGCHCNPLKQEGTVATYCNKKGLSHFELIRILLVPGEGFEPPTNGLQNRCSTTELTRHKCLRSLAF